ncbi:hypothetical protein BDP27DRAFT_1312194 [Rhodocollybia butyracea]|uniref:Uncharacterized protein n=1 Tax=Rhodocollybia butyracea TaxID=206335 RepID=A0A9P5QBC5_9AGAR|nr:hypothetical protein BDP27DRAFT_1312194 [Rhodocollybia butyracea]
MISKASEIPPKPIIDVENPLYCPTESASTYLKSIATTGAKIQKSEKHEKRMTKKKGQKISVSSFMKMLTQVAVVMAQKEKIPLSLSTSDCHDYGTPSLPSPTRRPVRKTRKDRAAQSLHKKMPELPEFRQDPSPNVHSISISLPKMPIDDWLSASPASTICFPNPTFTDISDGSCSTLTPTAPLVPPGLSLQVKSEPQEPSLKSQSNPTSATRIKPFTANSKQKNKRSLQDAFPDLFKPTNCSRSFSCDFQPKQEPGVNQGSDESFTPLELEQEDIKGIERGKKLKYMIGNSPDFAAKHSDDDEAKLDKSTLVKRRLRELEESLYGPVIGTETPRGYASLVQRLDEMMPGIRLGNRLAKLGQPKSMENTRQYEKEKSGPHQAAVDLLGAEGLLNERIINMFRASEVTRLDLGPSLSEEGGLNMAGRAVWDILTRPHSFLFLTELSFNDTPLLNMDLVKLIGLPRLAILGLKNTGIGDEGVFHLTALKLTLTHLYLSNNPGITDDAVPALNLCIASKLCYLGLVGTSIAMPGLRWMASLIHKEERVVDVEIPESCEHYIEGIPNFYLLHPQPPLITSPVLCPKLSAGALQRNLEAHAEVANKHQAVAGKAAPSRIFTGGTKEEMCERLRELLVRREVDLVVWEMVYGHREGGVGE